jgi:hypothetical protein
MIAKMSQKIRQTSRTLAIAGIACTSAFTTTWRKKMLAHDRLYKNWFRIF